MCRGDYLSWCACLVYEVPGVGACRDSYLSFCACRVGGSPGGGGGGGTDVDLIGDRFVHESW